MKAPVYSGLTDPGLVRPHNEDRFGIAPELGLAIVADGMGGHAAGEVASQMAIDIMLAILRQTAGVAAAERLETALQAAHGSILEKAASSTRYQGMGTTVVATLIEKDLLSHAHVGDSRLYRLRNKQLDALTKDHSLQQEFIDQGHYSEAEAREKVARNILTRALGLETDLKADVGQTRVQSGDRYLLCSDGLYEMVNDGEIASWLARGMAGTATCEALIELANARGGRDNITTVLIDIP
ncbi:MAG: Stp1/IreP family PP2C-type Ser/Thr phosphatase [Moraxellaceae bacterium]|nr:Stp1/IreP family PP2C-type Ser/Thr phosphatase [Moraxellaceae bacterium]